MFSSSLIILASLEWFDCVSGLTRENTGRSENIRRMNDGHARTYCCLEDTNHSGYRRDYITLIENQGDRSKPDPVEKERITVCRGIYSGIHG